MSSSSSFEPYLINLGGKNFIYLALDMVKTLNIANYLKKNKHFHQVPILFVRILLPTGVFGNSKNNLLFYDLEFIYVLERLVNLKLYFLFLEIVYKLEFLPLKMKAKKVFLRAILN